MRNHSKNQRGSAMLELALGSTLLMPLLFGTADFGRLFYASIEVESAATAGVSYGSLSVSNMSDTAGISSAATNDAPDITGLQITSSQVCQDNSGNVESCTTANAYK